MKIHKWFINYMSKESAIISITYTHNMYYIILYIALYNTVYNILYYI